MASFNPANNNNQDNVQQAGPLAQAMGWWNSAPMSTRIISVGLAILVILCFTGAVMLATEPEYTDLFNNLDPHDAAAIAQKLDDEHEKYQISDDDTTIKVPIRDKDRLRMEMIREGLPSKSGSVVGTDLISNIPFTASSDIQAQYIRMAQESELAQTISSMNEVSSAAVHLSPGNNSPFAGNDTPPSASVVIGLKPGMQLTSDQTMGIANLVAKAVTGLDLKNIAIVDTDGNQLWDGSNQSGPSGLASTRLVAEHLYAEDMRRQMQSYLDTVLGAHKAIVSVAATLNYDQVHEQQTQYTNSSKDPKNPLMISQQTNDENYSSDNGTASPVGKPAGIASNSPGAPSYPDATAAGSHTGKYDHKTEIDNYENDKTETDTQEAPGAIQSLRVAVLIDSTVLPDTQKAVLTYLQTMAGWTGIKDTAHIVTLSSFPFSNVDAKTQQDLMAKANTSERIQEFVKIGAVAVVAIVLLIIFMRSSKAALRTVVGTPLPSSELVGGYIPSGHILEPAAPSQFPDYNSPPQLAQAQSPQQFAPGIGSTLDHVSEQPVSIEDMLDEIPAPRKKRKKRVSIDGIEEHVDVKLESVREMVQDSPETVALLMKGWITNDDTH